MSVHASGMLPGCSRAVSLASATPHDGRSPK